MPDSPEDTGGVTGIILARIEVKLDTALSTVMDHEHRIRALEAHNTTDHGARLTALERWRYAVPAALVVTLISGATAVITTLIK